MELNIESVKDCDAMRMKPTDHRPHYITRYDFVVKNFVVILPPLDEW